MAQLMRRPTMAVVADHVGTAAFPPHQHLSRVRRDICCDYFECRNLLVRKRIHRALELPLAYTGVRIDKHQSVSPLCSIVVFDAFNIQQAD
jgi:hypothetical protein